MDALNDTPEPAYPVIHPLNAVTWEQYTRADKAPGATLDACIAWMTAQGVAAILNASRP